MTTTNTKDGELTMKVMKEFFNRVSNAPLVSEGERERVTAIRDAYIKLEAFAKRITYKPNTRFRIYQTGLDNLEVVFSMVAPDVDRLPELVNTEIHRNMPISCYAILAADDARLSYYFRELIQGTEIHEMYEWLKLDGKLITEPRH